MWEPSKYCDLLVESRSITEYYYADLWVADKSQYFAIVESKNCFIVHFIVSACFKRIRIFSKIIHFWRRQLVVVSASNTVDQSLHNSKTIFAVVAFFSNCTCSIYYLICSYYLELCSWHMDWRSSFQVNLPMKKEKQ